MVHFSIFNLSEVIIKKKKPLVNMTMLSKSSVNYVDSHQLGKVDLKSGRLQKDSFPPQLRQRIICFEALLDERGDHVVAGLLASGEIFFYTAAFQSLRIFQGPTNLFIPEEFKPKRISSSNFQAFTKQFFQKATVKSLQREAKAIETNHVADKICFSFKPRFSATPNLTKAVLIGNYDKIFLWQRTVKTTTLETKSVYSGFWTTIEAPSHQPLPTKEYRGKAWEISFNSKGLRGPVCYIRIGFMKGVHLVISTLVISWNTSSPATSLDPCICWTSININMCEIEDRNNVVNRRGSLVMKAACEANFLVSCLNTFSNKFHLVYSFPDSIPVSVVSSMYPKYCYRANDSRYHWVVALNWTCDNSFLIGCLKSGHVFLSTRMGNLLQIFCENLQLSIEPNNYLSLFEDSSKYSTNDDASISTSEASVMRRPKFSIVSNFKENTFLISSGFHLYLFALPKDVTKDKDVASFLLKQTHLANHVLQNLCNEHHYDYIHCSSWRLARSLMDIDQATRNEDETAKKNKFNLWLPGNFPNITAVSSIPLTDVENQVTETFEALLSSWSYLTSSTNLSKNQRKSLSGAAISEALNLLETILVASPVAGDHEEHQVRLIQSLRLFHQLIKFGTNVNSSLMVMTILKLTHKYIHLVMMSTNQSSEMKLAYILILTQTLTSLENALYSYDAFISHRTRSHWLCLYKNVSMLWKQDLPSESSSFHYKIRAVTGIIQGKVLPYSKSRQSNTDAVFKMLVCGKLKTGMDTLKQRIVSTLNSTAKEKELKKYISYGFYSLVINNDLGNLIEFVSWCYRTINEKCDELNEQTSNQKGSFKRRCFIKILKSLFGSLGIILAKSTLTHQRKTSLENILKNNLDSIPRELCTDFRVCQENENVDVISALVAVICLIMGGKWNCVSFIAKIMGDYKLCLIAALAANEQERTKTIAEKILVECLSSHLVNSGFDNIDYKTIQCFLQLSAMLELDILQSMLMMNLMQMEELVSDLSFNIHDQLPLPSPHWFCPQFETDEECDFDNFQTETYSYRKEIWIRKKVSKLIFDFSVLVKAAGISSILLDVELKELKEDAIELGELKNIISSLRLKTFNKEEKGPSSSLKKLVPIWKKFIDIIWSLHLRDEVSFHIREWTQLKVNKTQISTLQERSSHLLQLCKETFPIREEWQTVILNLITTVATDALPTLEAVSAVAAVASKFEQIPSLTKQRFDQLLDQWKGRKLVTSEGITGTNSRSAFDCFECELARLRHSDETDVSSVEHLQGKLNILCSFATMTFLKLEQLHGQPDIPFPFLKEFSSQINELESSCMKLVSDLINYQNERNIESCPSRWSMPCNVSDSIQTDKKGLFRNIKKYTGSNDESLALIVYNGIPNQLPSLHQSRRRRNSTHSGRENKKRYQKRSHSWNPSSKGDRLRCKKVTLTPVSLITSKPKSISAFDDSNALHSIFFSNPLVSRKPSNALPEHYMSILLWIADDRRRWPTDVQKNRNDFNAETSFSLLSIEELKQALNWIARKATPSHGEVKLQSSSPQSDLLTVPETEAPRDQPTVNMLISSAFDQMKMNSKKPQINYVRHDDRKSAGLEFGADDADNKDDEEEFKDDEQDIKDEDEDNNPYLSNTRSKVIQVHPVELNHSSYQVNKMSRCYGGMDTMDNNSNRRNYEPNKQCSIVVDIQGGNTNQLMTLQVEGSLTNSNETVKKKDENIEINSSSRDRLIPSTAGFWRRDHMLSDNNGTSHNVKEGQSHSLNNPWKPFSTVDGSCFAKTSNSENTSKLTDNMVSILPLTTSISELPNYSQQLVDETDSSSGSGGSAPTSFSTPLDPNDNTLNDLTISGSLQFPNDECHERPSLRNQALSIRVVQNDELIFERRTKQAKKEKVHFDRKEKYLMSDTKPRSPLRILTIPKLTSQFETGHPKWVLKQIFHEPSDDSADKKNSGQTAPFKLLKVPTVDQAPSVQPANSGQLKFMDPAKVLAHYQRKNNKCGSNPKISKGSNPNELLQLNIRTQTDEHSEPSALKTTPQKNKSETIQSQAEKYVQTSISENKQPKEVSYKYVQTNDQYITSMNPLGIASAVSTDEHRQNVPHVTFTPENSKENKENKENKLQSVRPKERIGKQLIDQLQQTNLNLHQPVNHNSTQTEEIFKQPSAYPTTPNFKIKKTLVEDIYSVPNLHKPPSITSVDHHSENPKRTLETQISSGSKATYEGHLTESPRSTFGTQQTRDISTTGPSLPKNSSANFMTRCHADSIAAYDYQIKQNYTHETQLHQDQSATSLVSPTEEACAIFGKPFPRRPKVGCNFNDPRSSSNDLVITLGARNVVVDMRPDVRDDQQEDFSHVIREMDIPEEIVKKQLATIRNELNQPASFTRRRSVEMDTATSRKVWEGFIITPKIKSNLEVTNTKVVVNEKVFDETTGNLPPARNEEQEIKGGQYSHETNNTINEEVQITNSQNKNDHKEINLASMSHINQRPYYDADDILDMFIQGDINVTDACDLLHKNPQGEFNTREITDKQLAKERLSQLIIGADKAQENIIGVKEMLAKVDKVINDISNQEVERFDNRRRKRRHSSNGNQIKVQEFTSETDMMAFIEEADPKELRIEEINTILDTIWNNNNLVNTNHSITVLIERDFLSPCPTSNKSKRSSPSPVGPGHERIQSSPSIPLDLAFLSGEATPLPTSPSKSEVNLDDERRRKEVRAWMKQKRLRRQEARKALSERNTEGPKEPVTPSEPCLTGRKIREMGKEAEQQRLQQREQHATRRQRDAENLLQSFYNEKEIFKLDSKQKPLKQDRTPQESLRHDRTPQESLRHDRTPQESLRHDRTPQESLRHDRTPQESLRHDRTSQKSTRQERLPYNRKGTVRTPPKNTIKPDDVRSFFDADGTSQCSTTSQVSRSSNGSKLKSEVEKLLQTLETALQISATCNGNTSLPSTASGHRANLIQGKTPPKTVSSTEGLPHHLDPISEVDSEYTNLSSPGRSLDINSPDNSDPSTDSSWNMPENIRRLLGAS